MNSEDLRQHALASWRPFRPNAERQLLRAIPESPGVYALRAARPFGRFVGESDIVYIGSTTRLRRRIRFYFHPGPTQLTNLRIRKMLKDRADVQLAFATSQDADEAKELEEHLLERYETEHGELPPFNRQVRKPERSPP